MVRRVGLFTEPPCVQLHRAGNVALHGFLVLLELLFTLSCIAYGMVKQSDMRNMRQSMIGLASQVGMLFLLHAILVVWQIWTTRRRRAARMNSDAHVRFLSVNVGQDRSSAYLYQDAHYAHQSLLPPSRPHFPLYSSDPADAAPLLQDSDGLLQSEDDGYLTDDTTRMSVSGQVSALGANFAQTIHIFTQLLCLGRVHAWGVHSPSGWGFAIFTFISVMWLAITVVMWMVGAGMADNHPFGNP